MFADIGGKISGLNARAVIGSEQTVLYLKTYVLCVGATATPAESAP